jgi:peptidoglycan/xylan/chitin deacetylase (PgdA/CDA1 family)
MAELADAQPPGPARSVVITFDDGFADNLSAVDALQHRGMRASWFVVTGSIGRLPSWPSTGRPPGRILDAPELRRMHAAGMEIGSHTVNHHRLTELAPAQVSAELTDSRKRLADVLGAPVRSFAYPYGAFSDSAAAAVQAAGYDCACTTRSGWAMRDGDPWRMRRLTISNQDSTATLARKLYFGDNDVSWTHTLRILGRRLRSAANQDRGW